MVTDRYVLVVRRRCSGWIMMLPRSTRLSTTPYPTPGRASCMITFAVAPRATAPLTVSAARPGRTSSAGSISTAHPPGVLVGEADPIFDRIRWRHGRVGGDGTRVAASARVGGAARPCGPAAARPDPLRGARPGDVPAGGPARRGARSEPDPGARGA